VSVKNYFICYYDLFPFKNREKQIAFDQWMNETRLQSITYITALTAFMYIIFAYLNQLYLPKNILPTALFFHLFLVPSILFFISFLAYKKKNYCFISFLLIVATLLAAVGNALVVSSFHMYSTYQVEIYLMIFWIFTVSGQNLFKATVSALLVSIVSIIFLSRAHAAASETFITHLFWIFASLSFGFLGAFLFQSSQQKLFLNHAELETKAVTDKLTGLFNRTRLDHTLVKQLTKSRQSQGHFGMILLDLDFFKKINDTFGHHVGDSVLVQIAAILQQNIRSYDMAIRWGGEEFLLICFEMNKDTILKLSNNIRQKIEQHDFKDIHKATVSLGVTLKHEKDTIDDMIQRADKALYQAKNKGRNCTVFLD
jgi:diguanylate cyclase (GGDEF)-like protein